MQADWLALYSAVMVLVAIMFKLAVHNAIEMKRQKLSVLEEDRRLVQARLNDAEERRESVESTRLFMTRRRAMYAKKIAELGEEIAALEAAALAGEDGEEVEDPATHGAGEGTPAKAAGLEDNKAAKDKESAAANNATRDIDEETKGKKKDRQIRGPDDNLAPKDPNRKIKGPGERFD